MIKLLKFLIKEFVAILYKGRYGRLIIDEVTSSIRNNKIVITNKGHSFVIAAPNSLSYYRIDTFFSKEPETIEWIDKFEEKKILWDIGANIGLYSIYAAKTSGVSVFAFEPSVFNVELLARNINLNQLSDKICIVPIPLSDKPQFSLMRMSSTEWGGALSTFEKDIGWDGNQISEVFNYQVWGSTIDEMLKKNSLPFPDYIKIDVDGIEHFILQGGLKVLSGVKEVLIEINDSFAEQAHMCDEILIQSGLTLLEKRHSEEFEEQGAFGGGQVWNQIWTRLS
jgi:FkbM family methyltransferase